MGTPTAGRNCGQAGYLKAISPSHGEADNFPVLLRVMKTRLFECSIECGSYRLFSCITMKGYGLDFLSTCQVLPDGVSPFRTGLLVGHGASL